MPPSKVDLSKMKMTCSVVGLTKENLAKVVEYDKKIVDDLDRADFLRLFVSQECSDTQASPLLCPPTSSHLPETRLPLFLSSLLQIAVDEASRIIGYGTARLLINDELFIGPLYANSPVRTIPPPFVIAILEDSRLPADVSLGRQI